MKRGSSPRQKSSGLGMTKWTMVVGRLVAQPLTCRAEASSLRLRSGRAAPTSERRREKDAQIPIQRRATRADAERSLLAPLVGMTTVNE
jgi:hypothetical protein